ncbi:MAG: glycosyltransferase family 4 protein [Bacteroidia bacterium]|nr:glycosyltransferase family 4 protein [Bacteroidia bacterium]
MKNILYIASHRADRAPGQRFRFEQYFEYLGQNGYHCELSYYISERDDKYLYLKGYYIHKLIILIKAVLRRLKDLRRAGNYDVLFIHREAFLLGSTYFERRFRKSKARMIFDFDDSICLPDTSDANIRLKWLKNPAKTEKLIAMSDMVFAGNAYLGGYASRFNGNVKIVPTTINTAEMHRIAAMPKNGKPVCIGWTGSMTTIKHFELAVPVLTKIKEKYGKAVTIKVIGDKNYENKELQIKGIAWQRENEIEELSEFDIGIMPLPDDEWSKGKCALKGLEYMALEIPPVMSRVGVNTEIVADGVNGFLAEGEAEWMRKLELLIESAELRRQMGREALKTVRQKYSTDAMKGVYLDYLNSLFATDVPPQKRQ